MKNKKLFAILTLVCFMFTLMPVAAFAADLDANQVYVNENGTWKDDATVTAGSNNILAAVAGVTTDSYVFYAVDEDGEGVAVSVNGQFTIKAEGEYQIYAVETTEAITEYFESVGSAADKVAMIEDNYSGKIVDEYAVVEAEAVDDAYDFVFTKEYVSKNATLTIDNENDEQSARVKANNGYDYVEVTVQLLNNGEKVKAEEITVSHSSYVTVDADADVTDKKGQITYKVAAKRGGDVYPITFKYDGYKETLDVTAWTEGVEDVEVAAEPKAARNIDTAHQSTGVELKFFDVDGIALGKNEVVADDYSVTVVSQPAKGDAEAKDFFVNYDETDKVWKLMSKEKLDEGTYEIKVSLENGKSVKASFSVAEMGDVVRIMFSKAPTSITFGGEQTISDNKVVALDAKGVSEALKVANENLTLTVNGKAVASAEYEDTTDVQGNPAKKFVIETKTEDAEKYVGTTVTVMAAYEVDDETFVATLDLEVVDAAAGFVYDDAKAEVAVTANLTATPVDENGKETDLNADVDDAKVIVLEKPANAYVNVDAAWDEANNEVDVEFLATVAGEYKVQTIVATDNIYVSSINTITVGANEGTFKDVVVVSMGANSMIVNNELVKLDVAPFIENNRTMMQFNVLYVFGVDVQWVAETQSIVAEGNGLKVVMQLGSKVATVNGEEVALDVAPYSVNGRTVVPVGFITGLLDITPVFTYNADGTIADILFTK